MSCRIIREPSRNSDRTKVMVNSYGVVVEMTTAPSALQGQIMHAFPVFFGSDAHLGHLKILHRGDLCAE